MKSKSKKSSKIKDKKIKDKKIQRELQKKKSTKKMYGGVTGAAATAPAGVTGAAPTSNPFNDPDPDSIDDYFKIYFDISNYFDFMKTIKDLNDSINIDFIINIKKLCDDYKNRRLGQAITYIDINHLKQEVLNIIRQILEFNFSSKELEKNGLTKKKYIDLSKQKESYLESLRNSLNINENKIAFVNFINIMLRIITNIQPFYNIKSINAILDNESKQKFICQLYEKDHIKKIITSLINLKKIASENISDEIKNNIIKLSFYLIYVSIPLYILIKLNDFKINCENISENISENINTNLITNIKIITKDNRSNYQRVYELLLQAEKIKASKNTNKITKLIPIFKELTTTKLYKNMIKTAGGSKRKQKGGSKYGNLLKQYIFNIFDSSTLNGMKTKNSSLEASINTLLAKQSQQPQQPQPPLSTNPTLKKLNKSFVSKLGSSIASGASELGSTAYTKASELGSTAYTKAKERLFGNPVQPTTPVVQPVSIPIQTLSQLSEDQQKLIYRLIVLLHDLLPKRLAQNGEFSRLFKEKTAEINKIISELETAKGKNKVTIQNILNKVFERPTL